jgi:hypothetical protein
MPYGPRKNRKFRHAMDLIRVILALAGVAAVLLLLFGQFEAAYTAVRIHFFGTWGLLAGLLLFVGIGYGWRWLLNRKREQNQEGRYKKGRYHKTW